MRTRPGRSGRSRGRSPETEAGAFAQRPFRQPRRGRMRAVELASADEVEALHDSSLRLLRDTGIAVLHDQARAMMIAAGATGDSDGVRVRFDPELVLDLVAQAPASFTLHARNPAHDIVIGGDYLSFFMMASAPNASCMDKGRRTGNQQDFRDFLKLSQLHNILHGNGGYPCEPVDVHASIRHLDCIEDLLTLTDKSFCIYSLGAERNRDAIEMTRIGRGVSMEELMQQPSVWTVINTNSPLQLDIPMMQGIIEMSSMGQPVVITPFTLAGAMAPITIAGALVQQNAEALAGIAFSQIVRAGAPVIYGGFTSNVDMKSGSPAFGTPEYVKAQIIGGQLARRYQLPYRTSNVCAANSVDAQAGYESVFSLWGAINGGMNMLKHGAGWMEGGLCCSFEKTILDIDLLQMVEQLMTPLDFAEESLALQAIDEVGPGGHFFGTEHTQQRYRDAFYQPVLSDWRNYESWLEAGEPTAMQKANRVFKERLAAYEKPFMQPEIREELAAFVSRRKAEGGVATDF
ncbi:MAG: trimethylamine methyltransferase family protein [Granulosicoccus sp.]|nr:trimethylamine methyltransferase family protein [Granulosicoccus sp.]